MREMNGWQYYQKGNLAVVPYMHGTPVYVDGMLPQLYVKTRDEGKLADAFCGDEMNMDAFIYYFVKRQTMQVLVEVRDGEIIPVGYAWVDMPKGVDGARSAMCGFCFFDNVSSPTVPRDLAKLGIAYWLIDLRINVLHGVQLEENRAALNFSRRLGFTEVATVPKYHFSKGNLTGATIVVLEDEAFLPSFDEWMAEKPVADSE